MKSALAKARDKWFLSDDGKECCKGQTSGQYLQNRLERAFLAGANFSSERIKEIEVALDKYGNHTRGCAFTVGLGCCSIEECDCGFEQALKG